MRLTGDDITTTSIWDPKDSKINLAIAGRTPLPGRILWVPQCFLLTSYALFALTNQRVFHSRTALAISAQAVCLTSLLLASIFRIRTRSRSIRIHSANREELSHQLTAALEKIGLHLRPGPNGSLDFGPKTAFGSWLLGAAPVLIDFSADGLAIINGPQATLKKLRNQLLQPQLRIVDIGVETTW